MPGAVMLTVLVTYEDAAEVERRAEAKMLTNPRKWSTRTSAILDEIGLTRGTALVPRGTRVLRVEPKREGDVAHVIPAVVIDADVFATGPGTGRRRALHEAYFEELLLEQPEISELDEDEQADDEP